MKLTNKKLFKSLQKQLRAMDKAVWVAPYINMDGQNKVEITSYNYIPEGIMLVDFPETIYDVERIVAAFKSAFDSRLSYDLL